MKPKTLGWLIWGVATLAFIGVSTLTTLNGNLTADLAFVPIALISVFAYSVVGAILIAHDARNPIGWLFATFGLVFSVSGLLSELTEFLYTRDPAAPLIPLLAWTQAWLFALAIVPLVLILALFPDGRPASPRWRWLLWSAIVLGTAGVLATMLNPAPLDDIDIEIANPFGIEPLGDVIGATLAVWGTGLIVLFFASVASLVLRYRRAQGEERQQIRWLAYVALVAVVSFPLIFITQLLFESDVFSGLAFAAFFAAIGIGVPVACGIAVNKYRLYDLDLVIRKTVVFGILAVLMMAVGIVLLLFLAGSPDDPAWIAGLVLGLLVWPLWRASRRIADKVVFGGRASPYEVLTEFSERAGETYATDDVLQRMATVLGQGTGAEQASVWLNIASGSRLGSIWPRDGEAPASVPEDAIDVVHHGEALGSLAVRMPANDPMNPSKERLITDLAAQAGPVLRNVRLIEELRESRRRLVAAQDAERRRLERDIHDGVQQQLVALQVQLKLLEGVVERDPAKAKEMAAALQGASGAALEDLRDLARGIYPPLLADQGLTAALQSQARKAALPVVVEPDGVKRYPQEVEATVYFCCLEALNNIAKYAGASRATVRLSHRDGSLTFSVTDDGRGFDPSERGYGTGMQGMADRLQAIGGELTVESTPGEGTTVNGSVPAA